MMGVFGVARRCARIHSRGLFGKVSGRALASVNGFASASKNYNITPDNIHTNNASSSGDDTVAGDVLDLAVNLHSSRPGDRIQIPYELTVSDAFQGFWHSVFHAQNRINTSRPFARQIGLQDRVLPFSLALFLTSSMTHADAAKVQVGFGNAIYHWPAFAGDTFTKSFTVKSIRNTSDGHHSIFHFECELINQRGRVCMSADKYLIYEFTVPCSDVELPVDPESKGQLFRDHLISKSDALHDLGSHSLTSLFPGQLVLHTMNRSITFSQSQQLASLARLTHPRHFDTRRYDIHSEIFVPGGLVLGLTMSAASRDMHEILHEEILNASFVHHLHPGNIVGAMSYVQDLDDGLPGDLESLVVRTIGVKNMDVSRDLRHTKLPVELFTGEAKTTKEIEKICKERCPILSNNIVLQLDRRILRQASRNETFLL